MQRLGAFLILKNVEECRKTGDIKFESLALSDIFLLSRLIFTFWGHNSIEGERCLQGQHKRQGQHKTG